MLKAAKEIHELEAQTIAEKTPGHEHIAPLPENGVVQAIRKNFPGHGTKELEKLVQSYSDALRGHIHYHSQPKGTFTGTSNFNGFKWWAHNTQRETESYRTADDWDQVRKPEKPKTVRNQQTGKDEAIVDRSIMLDRYDHAEISDRLIPFMRSCDSQEKAINAVRIFCANERKDFDYVTQQLRKQYGVDLFGNGEQDYERDRGAVQTVGCEIFTPEEKRNGNPRPIAEVLQADSIT